MVGLYDSTKLFYNTARGVDKKLEIWHNCIGYEHYSCFTNFGR